MSNAAAVTSPGSCTASTHGIWYAAPPAFSSRRVHARPACAFAKSVAKLASACTTRFPFSTDGTDATTSASESSTITATRR